MHFEPRTPLGAALRLSLIFIWRQLRTAALSLHPVTPQALWRIARGQVRMHVLVARLDRLALRWLEGTLPKPRRKPLTPRAPKPRPTPEAQAAPKPPRERDPSGQAWLVRIWQPAAQGGEALNHIFATRQDLRDLVAASPQAGRLLRPLARMLGATLPDWLRLPPRAPRKPRPRKPRPERPWKLTDPRLNLPPNIIAAARYFRKKYG